MTALVCRNCGSDNITVWYSVPERQGIEILGVHESGNVSFEFDGVTEAGDAESDDEYWCRDCDEHSSNLEYLLGLTEVELTPKQAIEKIAGLLFQVGEIIGDRRDNAYPGYDTPDDPVWAYLNENIGELYDRFGAIIDSVEDEIFGEETRMSNYDVRTEAERIIGEDRVPMEVLQEIVERYGATPPARTIRVVTENLARTFGVDVRLIDEDHNGPPGDTSDYEGRALAFIFEADGVQLRVLVEDVTPDSERRSVIYQGIE